MKSSSWLSGLFAVLLLANVGSFAGAAIMFNEISIDPPSTDNGQEFLELKSSTGGVESLNGLTFVVFEGDGLAPGRGVLDVAMSLNGFSTGTNGLFLMRDSATVLSPAPAAGTSVNVTDFNPDLENGSNTYLLVTGFSGTVTTDYDTNDDGILDSTPWTTVVDSIGVTENDGANNIFYLGTGFPSHAMFNADAILRLLDGTWISTDANGTSPGPYTFDAVENQTLSGAPVSSLGTLSFSTLSPGNPNPEVIVPEPAAVMLVSSFIGIMFVTRRGR